MCYITIYIIIDIRVPNTRAEYFVHRYKNILKQSLFVQLQTSNDD